MLPGLKKEKKNDSASARKEVIISYCPQALSSFFHALFLPFQGPLHTVRSSSFVIIRTICLPVYSHNHTPIRHAFRHEKTRADEMNKVEVARLLRFPDLTHHPLKLLGAKTPPPGKHKQKFALKHPIHATTFRANSLALLQAAKFRNEYEKKNRLNQHHRAEMRFCCPKKLPFRFMMWSTFFRIDLISDAHTHIPQNL